MDKTMRTLIALLALVGYAYGQTYKTVTADTNNAIRTNFSLVRSQVSDLSGASFAISNITGLQAAIDGKLATNGSAVGLTNFPTIVLQTNSSLSTFPAGLLRTNGDASGLTNLPNANLSNATGVLPISNGGTGATNAAAAIQALLPSYTGNSNRILALNSNATSLVWATNSGEGATYSNSQAAMLGLFFAATNNDSINLFVNGGTNANNQHTVIGSGAGATGTNVSDKSVAIGAAAQTSRDGIAIGFSSSASRGLSIGYDSDSTGQGVALGWNAIAGGGNATNGSVAVGYFATAQTNSAIAIGDGADADGVGAIAIGQSSLALEDTNGLSGTAVGFDSQASGRGASLGANAIASGEASIAIGPNANASDYSVVIGDGAQVAFGTAIQLGAGTNTNDYTIQIWNAGSVTTNQWSALANATTIGTNLLQATDTTNAQNIIGLTNPATYPSFSNAASKVLAVTTNESGVEWIAVSNTVTDASLLTNFPSNLLRTNGSASELTNFPAGLLRTNGDASALTNFPTLNQNTTGTANNVSGVVQISNGGTGATNAANARANLLPSYSGNANRILALNSNATDVIWTTNSGGTGSVSSVAMTVPAFLSVSGSPITTNGTLAVSYSGTALPVANGGTGTTNSGDQTHINLGLTSSGSYWVRLGYLATAVNSAVAIGHNSDARSSATVAIGAYSDATNSYSISIGFQSTSKATAVSIGYLANSSGTNSVQLGTGTNTNNSTIQFLSAGTVNETEWGYLANASTQGGYAMTNTSGISGSKTFVAYDGTNYTTNTVTFSNGIITGWTP